MAITIPDGLFDIYNEAVAEMLRVFGVQCTLVYPPEKQACNNCVSSGIGGISNNVYRHGGPARFSIGNCPLCGGSGWKEIENTGTVRLRVYWTEKDWKKISYPSLQIPDGAIMTLGNLHDLPKLTACNDLLVNTAQNGYMNWRYSLAGEPFTHGFGKDKWCAAFWKREG